MNKGEISVVWSIRINWGTWHLSYEGEQQDVYICELCPQVARFHLLDIPHTVSASVRCPLFLFPLYQIQGSQGTRTRAHLEALCAARYSPLSVTSTQVSERQGKPNSKQASLIRPRKTVSGRASTTNPIFSGPRALERATTTSSFVLTRARHF